ncbi:MAG: hypothetical protein CM1200mP2_37150 [Planctomycetaceae bacterium]|nr:MAG: hypothetical protein CM1200mP2_37150 [Planctomycetaceae bacterium]
MTGTSFGALSGPSRSLTFDGAQVLRKGRNVFWLSCTLRAGPNMDHKLDAQCTEVVTTAGKVVPRDATPESASG